MDILDRARSYVDKMPVAVAGSGGHNATFHVACILVQGFGLSPDQAFELLSEYNTKCSPPWSEKDLRHKLRGADKAGAKRGRGWLAKGTVWTPSEKWREYHHIPEKKAAFEADKLATFAGEWAKRVDLVWLANRSAVDPAGVSPAQFLGSIFEEGEKAIVFTDDRSATIGKGLTLWPDTAPPSRGPEPRPCGVWFLNQPVDGQYHLNDDPDKPMTPRNHRAVIAWRYLVIESDEADTRQWLGALAQLPLRIVALYSSGGRSVHALVRIDAPTKEAWDEERDKLKAALTVLGGDPKTLTAVRLTRLPGCLRHGKMATLEDAEGKKYKQYQRFQRPKLQKLLYLNPRAPLSPLVDIFARRDVEKHWVDLAASPGDAGKTLIRWGLNYYAGVSSDVYAALREWEEGAK